MLVDENAFLEEQLQQRIAQITQLKLRSSSQSSSSSHSGSPAGSAAPCSPATGSGLPLALSHSSGCSGGSSGGGSYGSRGKGSLMAAAAAAAAASSPAPTKNATQLAATPVDVAHVAGQSAGKSTPTMLAGSPQEALHDATEKHEATAAVARTQEEKDAAIEELTQSFANQVLELKHFCEECGKQGAAPAAPLPPPQQAQCQALVVAVLGTCFQLVRLEGPDMQELVSASLANCESLEGGWSDTAPTFRAAARAMTLQPEQSARLLKLRRRWLRDIDRLFASRQCLNLQLISVLLPPVVAPVPSAPPATLPQLGDDRRTIDLVHDLEDNLRLEQRLWCKQDKEMFQVLSPLQGAVFITATAPLHCDPLALVNAVAEDSGDTESD